MTRPQSPTDIANISLAHLSTEPIANVEVPGSGNAGILNRQYDLVRQACLREYGWNFAQAYATLTSAGTGTANFTNKFELPNDFIRLNFVGQYRDYPTTEYYMGDRFIYANATTSLNIWYNKDVTEVTYMDSLFIDWFSKRLARDVAFAITKKKSEVERMTKLTAEAEVKAASVDGQEMPPKRIQKSKYLNARRGYGSFSRDNRYYQWT